MPLDFPASPNLNDTYSFNNKTWVWNGSAWELQSTGAINGIPIGNVTPSTGTFTTVSDSLGELRTVPENAKTASYTLIDSDAGKYISSNSSVTVPNSVFTSGQSVAVYNNSTGNITLVQDTGVTMYNIGTSDTGNRTLAQRGIATIFCVGANTFVVGGGGVS
jgi:hypothetical protein